MANKRNPKKGDTGRDAGGFVALPWVVLDSPAYQALSHPAKALLTEFARQYVRDNNGRLLASRAYLKARGWKSTDVVTRATRELIDAGFVHQTVMGHRPNKASWYAVTWRCLDRLPGYDAGAAETFVRSAYRKNAPLRPSPGTSGAAVVPSPGTDSTAARPSPGTKKPVFTPSSTPSPGHHLETPSPCIAEPVFTDSKAPTPTTPHVVLYETLGSLWAAVGCRSVWVKRKPDPKAKARHAQQAAIDRHTKPRQAHRHPPAVHPPTVFVRNDETGIKRIRDEYAQHHWGD
ncbi:MAG: hypothetical protein RLZZ352_2179 [Pseudomonadota bacterium]